MLVTVAIQYKITKGIQKERREYNNCKRSEKCENSKKMFSFRYQLYNPIGCGAIKLKITVSIVQCWPRVSTTCFINDTDYLFKILNIPYFLVKIRKNGNMTIYSFFNLFWKKIYNTSNEEISETISKHPGRNIIAKIFSGSELENYTENH